MNVEIYFKRSIMIRLAKYEDLDVIMKVYESARTYMKNNGNPTQWGNTYPPKELIISDIRQKQLYVYTIEQSIHAVFMFTTKEEPDYHYIENGSWKNNNLYGTIHRIASDGIVKGIFYECLDFCKKKMDNLRIDTHEKNKTMQHLLEKYGFEKCGIVYIRDKSPRIAYQMCK